MVKHVLMVSKNKTTKIRWGGGGGASIEDHNYYHIRESKVALMF